MRGILADVNVEGHLDRIITVFLESPEWIEFWSELELTAESFESLGLDPDTPDDEIWRACQQKGLVLVTTNRNSDGPTSLESVMRNENTLSSLPIITIADAVRVINDRAYAELVSIKILEYLTDMRDYLGSGRLYAP